ncbi:MAG: hypothetical protein BGO10_07710 [Chlamydia sp. 32-24]|nr:MAG: hypothetical protein BGO10_07710 [Chlamydia sp. 32-24]
MNKLTVWIRAWGNDITVDLEKLIILINLLKKELTHYEISLFIETNPDDEVIKLIEKYYNNQIKIITANLHSFSNALNTLIQLTPPDSLVLTLSLGVIVNPELIKKGLEEVEKGVFAYGWCIHPLNNNGTIVGLGWYNTAALLHFDFIKILKDYPLPSWIDNGFEGSIILGKETIPIGGCEEVVMMYLALKVNPKAIFHLNIKDSLKLKKTTGTDISFPKKIKRKVAVANYYMAKKIPMAKETLWQALKIVR